MPRRHIAALLLVLAVLAGAPAPAHAQRTDGLDQPLLGANRCGAGADATPTFTLAATGDTFPHENIQAVGEAQGYATLFDEVRPFLQAADCASAPVSALATGGGGAGAVGATATRIAASSGGGEDLALVTGVAAQIAEGANGWIPLLAVAALAIAILALAVFAFTDWQSYQRRGTRRGYRHRRSAYERFADAFTPEVAPPPLAPPVAPPVPSTDDDLLRSLLGE